MLTHISISFVPPAEMRYATVGDWKLEQSPTSYNGKEKIVITVADTGMTPYNILIATHELVEATLCWMFGITTEMVDKWDLEHPDADEPGEIQDCPYYWEHATASIVERIVCKAMSIRWEAYEDAVIKTDEEVRSGQVRAH